MRMRHPCATRRSASLNVLKNCVIFSLFLSVLAQAGACLSAQPSPPGEYDLKVLALPYLSFGPLMIAQEEKFFAEQGLRVEFVRMSRSSQAIPALARGELDVWGGTTSLSLFNAMAKEARIKIVADKGCLSPGGCIETAMMARKNWVKDVKAPTAELLKGRPMAVNPVSAAGFLFEKLLGTVGLTLDDVRVVDLPEPAKIEALASGTIDFAHANEPWVTLISDGDHAVPWVPLSQVAPDFQLAFLCYGPNLLDRNPEVGRRFMVAYYKGVAQYNQGKTERNLDILQKHTGLKRDLLKRSCWPIFRSRTHINPESLIEFQQWGKKKGFLETIVTKGQCWDPTFVDYADKILKGTAN